MILDYTTRNSTTTYHLRVEDRDGTLYARMKLTVRDPPAVLAAHHGAALEVHLGVISASELLQQTNTALDDHGPWRTFLAVNHGRAGIISHRRQPGHLTVGSAATALHRLPLLEQTIATLRD